MSKTRKQHRKQVVRKAVSALLAFTIALMPWNVTVTQAFASELDDVLSGAAEAVSVQEPGNGPEAAVEIPAAEAAPAVEAETQAPAAPTDEGLPAAGAPAAGAPAAGAPAADEGLPADEAPAADAPEEAKAAPRAVKAAETPSKVAVKVTITYLDTDGTMKTKSLRSTTLKAGGSTTVSASSYSSYGKNRTIDGIGYEFIGWQDAAGQIVSIPGTIDFDMAVAAMGEDGTATFAYTTCHVAHQPITVTIIAQGMVDASGAVADRTISSTTLSWGSGSSISLKKLESATGIKAGNSSKTDFTYQGRKYHYTGSWTGIGADSSSIDLSQTVMLYNKAGEDSATARYFSQDVTLVFAPEYEKTMVGGLDFYCIDNISTGSSSWSNADSLGQRSDFSSYSHTLKNPEVASPTLTPHYSFLQWVDPDNGAAYQAGDTFTYTVGEDGPADTVATYHLYAQWQPTVTVNYHDWDGTLLASIEQSGDIATDLAYAAPEIEGAEFLGWFVAADEDADEASEVYAAPEATIDPVARTEYDVYAHYSTSYGVQHSLQSLEDEGVFELIESSTFTNIHLGTVVEALASLYQGFSFDASLEGTLTSAKAVPGLVLQLLYARDSYTVTYVYEGTVPADAPELPADTMYKYGAAVDIADDPAVAGYTFSGWDHDGFDMPAEDVVITGSFTANPAPAPAPVPGSGSTQNPTQPQNPVVNPGQDPAASADAPVAAALMSLVESIDDDATPLAGAQGAWSLFDLAASLVTVLLAAAMLIGAIGRKRHEDEADKLGQDESAEVTNRKRLVRILSLVPAVAAAVLFILTQNLTQQMAILDGWSAVFALIALAAILLALASRKTKEDIDGDDGRDADKWMGLGFAPAEA